LPSHEFLPLAGNIPSDDLEFNTKFQ